MMSWLRKSKFARSEDGATAVEFALIAMPLITLTFGIVEFGRLMLANQEVSYAADLAYRHVILKAAALDATEISDLSAQLQSNLTVAGSVLVTTVDTGTTIKIDADYDFVLLLPILDVSTVNLHETLYATVALPTQ